MKHKYSACLLGLIFILAMTGCTHYKGGDPDLWGLWKLDALTIDGQPDPNYDGNVFWAFQSSIIMVQEVDDEMHESLDHYGTWSLDRETSTLTLTFNYANDQTPPGTGMYAPPAVIYITAPVTALNVIELKDKTMTASHVAGGRIITYSLRRWN